MCGKGVPERVSAESGILGNLVEEDGDDLLNASHREPLGSPANENGGAVSAVAGGRRNLVPLPLIVSERHDGMVVDRNDALLPPLPAHFHLLAHGIDVLPVDALELRQAHSRGIEQLEDGRVSDILETATRRARPNDLKQEID